MQKKGVFILLAGGILVFILGFWASRATGEAGEPQAAEGRVTSGISYQGYVVDEAGEPLTGSHNFSFEIFKSASGGSRIWTQTMNNTAVHEGLVDLVLDIDPADFNGQALWLSVIVDGQRLSPRQELRPAPYALSLRPGAEITGSSGDYSLTVRNNGSGTGIYGETDGNQDWVSAGVHGYSFREKTFGVLGVSENGVGAQGTVTNTANPSPALVGFHLGPGAGVEGYSEGGNGVVGSAYMPETMGGRFENYGGGAGVYAAGSGENTPDLILGAMDGEDNGVISSDLNKTTSDLAIVSNDWVQIAVDDNNDEDSEFTVVNGEDEIMLQVFEDGTTQLGGGLHANGAVIAEGDLYAQNKLFTKGPVCQEYGPFTQAGNHVVSVPDFCLDALCWVVLETDAEYFGAFGPGIFWPVLYWQRTDDNHWTGGPNLAIGGAALSGGMGVNGDGVSEAVAGGSETAGGGMVSVLDDKGGQKSPTAWTVEFKPYTNELSYVSLVVCPMGQPLLNP